MGLDDFASGGGTSDDDENDTSTSKSKSGSTTSDTTSGGDEFGTLEDSEMTFYGNGDPDVGTRPMERKGAMSDYGVADLQQTKQGDIEVDYDSVKFFLPMFALITPNSEYEEGERYQLKHNRDVPRASWHNKVVACTTSTQTTLGKMNKEMVMLASGTTSKKRAMEFINSKFDDKVTGSTEVYTSYMLDCMFARDLAQASEEFRAGDNINRDDIAKRVIQPKMLRLALERDDEE